MMAAGFLWAALGCLAVGLMIGWCGVAGFLLPILFVQVYGLPVSGSLFISFVCFAVSGVIGSLNYARRGELALRPAVILGMGSLLGGLAGAALGTMMSAETARTALYLVVLASGCAIAVRELRTKAEKKDTGMPAGPALFALGVAAAVLCAACGAGGPVLVMPLLVALGTPAKLAVGTALFDSVFIALPAIVVYGAQSDVAGLLSLLLVSAASHALGVFVGSMTARHVPQMLLKRGVAVFSIVFAIYKLFL